MPISPATSIWVRQTLAEFGGTIALEDGGETAFTVTVPKGNRL